MGTYDEFMDIDIRHQVKCFGNTFHQFVKGDRVPVLNGERTYMIFDHYANKYIFVSNCFFTGIMDNKLLDIPIFNKWGGKLNNS